MGSPYASNPWQPQSRRVGGSSVLIKVLIGIGALFALGILAAIAIPVFVSKQSDVYQRTSIAMPETAAGFVKAHDSRTTAFNKYYDSLTVTGPLLAGMYFQPDGGPGTVLVVVKTRVVAAQYSQVLADLQKGAGLSNDDVLSTFTDVNAGPLGGRMQCAPFTIKTVQGTGCTFVDGGSYGLVVIYQPDNQKLVLQLRSIIEKRS